jgi:dihydroorotase
VPIAPGAPGNLCVIDPSVVWVREAASSASKSRNDPWDGVKLTGRVRHTVLAGTPTVIHGEPQR